MLYEYSAYNIKRHININKIGMSLCDFEITVLVFKYILILTKYKQTETKILNFLCFDFCWITSCT